MPLFSRTWFKWFFGTCMCVVMTAGGYAYYNVAYSVCRVPVYYDIGTIDPGFHLSKTDARAAVSDAESLWEDATGKNLFSYKAGASFKINFVYDERQKTTTEARTAKLALDKKAETNNAIKAQYDGLRAKYLTIKSSYDAKVTDYESRLSAYNTEVASWNEKGGAPSDVYANLARTKASLDQEHKVLNTNADSLNTIARQLNAVGEQGSRAIVSYNKDVDAFNIKYGKSDEFTEGDYKAGRINIYQYGSPKELKLVLAHELGHALSMNHVSDPNSIMYYLMEGQSSSTTATASSTVPTLADLAEFHRVCGTR